MGVSLSSLWCAPRKIGAETDTWTTWALVVPHVDPISQVSLRLVNSEMKAVIDDNVEATDLQAKANALSPHQQRRLRRLCEAYVSCKYKDIERAQSDVKPQDVFVFPDLARAARQALSASAIGVARDHSQLLANPRLADVRNMRRSQHIVEELFPMLGLSIPEHMSRGLDTFARGSLDEMIASRHAKVRSDIAHGYFHGSMPASAKYHYGRFLEALNLVENLAKREKYKDSLQICADGERDIALDLLRRRLTQSVGQDDLDTSSRGRLSKAIEAWENAGQNWYKGK